MPGDDIAHSLVVQQCREQTCHGDLARVTILRDESGRAGGLRFDGDLGTCSHPPAIYVDPRGATVHSVALRPVSKEEAESIAAETAKKIAPFREAEAVTCREVLDGSWVPEAKGRSPRSLRLPFEPGWHHASYVVSGHVFDVRSCPPCPPGAACKPCEETIRLQSHPEDNTAERMALVRIGRHGLAPAKDAQIEAGGWYVFVVEPRSEKPPQGWRNPLTLLSARKTSPPPR